MLIDKIKADALAARKSSNRIRASVLVLLIGECERVAKVATDDQVKVVAEKIIKNINGFIATKTADESYIRVLENEVYILREYFPVEEIPSMETVVNSIIALNPDKEINDKTIGWFVGQVMKATKGHYKMDEVKQCVLDQSNT